MDFAEVLKDLRESHNLTQDQLAQKLDVSRSTISGYESRNRQPDFEKLLAISKLFHVSVDYLLTGVYSREITLEPLLNEKALDKKAKQMYQRLPVEQKASVVKFLEFLLFHQNHSIDK